jgi:hypothetical protein
VRISAILAHGRTASPYVLEYLDSEIRAKSENGVKNWKNFTPVATITVNAFIDIL